MHGMHSVPGTVIRSPPIRQTHSRGSQPTVVTATPHSQGYLSDRTVQRTDTLPATANTGQVPKQQQLGPGGTHIITPESSTTSVTYSRQTQASSSLQQQQQQQQPPQAPNQAPVKGNAARAPPPSPPAIATLDDGGERGRSNGTQLRASVPRSRTHSRPSSRNGRRVAAPSANVAISSDKPQAGGRALSTTSPAKRSSAGSGSSALSKMSGSGGTPKGGRGGSGEGDMDADADVDADAEAELDAEAEVEGEMDVDADADPDAELLEAVDAAEANSAGSHSHGHRHAVGVVE